MEYKTHYKTSYRKLTVLCLWFARSNWCCSIGATKILNSSEVLLSLTLDEKMDLRQICTVQI